MYTTQHIQRRMSQRGVSRAMVELVLDHGRPQQNGYVLGRKEAKRRLKTIQQEGRLLKKVLDKGGVSVVTEGDVLITTYRCDPQHGKRRQS